MKTKIIASIAVVGTVAALAALATNNSVGGFRGSRFLQSTSEVPDETLKTFQGFVQTHNKNYLTKEEYNARLAVFSKNLAFVMSHDSAALGFELGINKFADLSSEEFDKMQGLKVPAACPPGCTCPNCTSQNGSCPPGCSCPKCTSQNGSCPPGCTCPKCASKAAVESEGGSGGHCADKSAKTDDTPEADGGSDGRCLQSSYPDSINWVTKGAVNAVRNQGGCGGCYTFSSVASLEGAYFIKNGALPMFSEQQLLDCTSSYGNSGCFGGLMSNAFTYLKTHKAMTRSSYPYTATAGACKYDTSDGVINITGYTSITKNDPDAHMAALQNGPVSIAIAASSSYFQFYKTGVITSTGCGTSVNHAVNMVGYGTDTASGNPYWLIRNSWGANWGDKGYFKVLRGSSNSAGICGILSLSSQPII